MSSHPTAHVTEDQGIGEMLARTIGRQGAWHVPICSSQRPQPPWAVEHSGRGVPFQEFLPTFVFERVNLVNSCHRTGLWKDAPSSLVSSGKARSFCQIATFTVQQY